MNIHDLEVYLGDFGESERRAKVAADEFQRRDPKHRYGVIAYPVYWLGDDRMGSVVYGAEYHVVRYRRFLWFLIDKKWVGPVFEKWLRDTKV